jgi:hypothetical protein
MIETILSLHQENFIKEPSTFLFRVMLADTKEQTTLTTDGIKKFCVLLQECQNSELNFIDTEKFLFQWMTDVNFRNDFSRTIRFNTLPKGLNVAVHEDITKTSIFSLTEEYLQKTDKQIAFCKKYGLKTEKERILQNIAVCLLEQMIVKPQEEGFAEKFGEDDGWGSIEIDDDASFEYSSSGMLALQNVGGANGSVATLESVEVFMGKHSYEPFEIVKNAAQFLKLACTRDDAFIDAKLVELKENIEMYRDQQISAASSMQAYDPRMTTNLTRANKSVEVSTFANIIHLVKDIQAKIEFFPSHN